MTLMNTPERSRLPAPRASHIRTSELRDFRQWWRLTSAQPRRALRSAAGRQGTERSYVANRLTSSGPDVAARRQRSCGPCGYRGRNREYTVERRAIAGRNICGETLKMLANSYTSTIEGADSPLSIR